MTALPTPRFSILMPVFNRCDYLREAIDSVFSQTFKDFELIIIDDGSSDASLEVIASYGPRVKFLQQSHQGPEVARNYGATHARGEYLVFLDSDDFFFPFALATLDRVIRHFHSPPLILATVKFFEQEQVPPTPPSCPIEIFRYKNFLSRTRPLGTAITAANLMDSIVVRKSVFEEVGGMRASSPETFYNEDSHLLLKLGTQEPCVVIQRPAITAYRKHDNNMTGSVTGIAEGWLRLSRAERLGEYPGKNKWGRYAHIGGRTLQWAVNYCWPNGQRKLALQLLLETFPMIAVALVNKAVRGLPRSDAAIVLD